MERAKEEKELDDLRKIIDEQIDNLNKSNVTYEFMDLLLKHEESEIHTAYSLHTN